MQVTAKGIHGETLFLPATSTEDALQAYACKTGVPLSFLRGTQCSRPVRTLNPEYLLCISLKVLGGKGGFGSLLRGQGMVVRVDNFEACRDLNGRRIRHANDEIRLKEWEEHQQQEVHTLPTEAKLPQKRPRPEPEAYKAACTDSSKQVKSAVAEALKKVRVEDLVKQPEPKPKTSLISKIKLSRK